MELNVLFLPYEVKRWTDEEIEKSVRLLADRYNNNADTMFLYSENIELIANICYLYGEVIARTTNEIALMKLQIDSRYQKCIVSERKRYMLEHPDEKAPNIEYFKALANDLVEDDMKKYLNKKELLDRFKYAYENMETKMNAIKKKQEAVKYEDFGGA